jgi:hypothetical protein
MKKVPTQTTVKVVERYDSLSLTIAYPSGAKFKYLINRSGESVELAFSNNLEELKAQIKEMKTWIDGLQGTNFERLKHVEKVLTPAKSGKEAMELMRADAKIKA